MHCLPDGELVEQALVLDGKAHGHRRPVQARDGFMRERHLAIGDVNGRISELLQQTRVDSRADLETTLLNYLKLYNYHIPQRAIGTRTPIQALKEWQQQKPDLFVKRVYDQTGLDS
jgi:hypothetical protein